MKWEHARPHQSQTKTASVSTAASNSNLSFPRNQPSSCRHVPGQQQNLPPPNHPHLIPRHLPRPHLIIPIKNSKPRLPILPAPIHLVVQRIDCGPQHRPRLLMIIHVGAIQPESPLGQALVFRPFERATGHWSVAVFVDLDEDVAVGGAEKGLYPDARDGRDRRYLLCRCRCGARTR